MALLQDVDTLNPFLADAASSTQLNKLNYDLLTDFSPADGSPVPAIAQSWTTSADKRTWTFTLRPGLTWSDGVPLTAADVAYTYNVIRDNPAQMVNASQVANMTSVTAPDPGTVVITSKVPTPIMLALDIPIVPEHVWRPLGDVRKAPATSAVVGSGPFQLVEARTGQFYRLAANPHYRGGRPKVDEVDFVSFQNADAVVQALGKGDIDFVGTMTSAQYDTLAADQRVQRNEARTSRFVQLAVNPGAADTAGTAMGDGHPALKDQRVRVAIDHAVDRSVLVDRVLGGHGEAGDSYLPASMADWHWTPDAAVRRGFDPAAANRILDEAGYRRGKGGIRTMPDGKRPLEFRLFVSNGTPAFGMTAPYLQSWLGAIGIKVRASLMSSSQLDERTGAGRYDLFIGGWRSSPDPDFVLSVQTCGTRPAPGADGGALDAFHCDSRYDDLYARQGSEVDRVKRIALVKRMQQRMYETAAQLILYYPYSLEAYRGDRFTQVARRPTERGSVIGMWAYASAIPVRSPAVADTGRRPVLVWAGIAVVAVLGGLAVAVVLRRRRAARDRHE